jgi:uncharacterized protein with PIN domain
MLGSIARKLRIFGYDTLYVAHLDDSEVLRIGVDQGRTILTADKEFFKRIVKANALGVLVGGSDELQDIVHILMKNGVASLSGSGNVPRCSMCNVSLAAASADELKGQVPANVAASQKTFFRCASCGKIYWEGSHMKRIRLLANAIDIKLADNHASASLRKDSEIVL